MSNKEKIVNYLDKYRFKHKLAGFNYLAIAIENVIKNPSKLRGIGKEVYKPIADSIKVNQPTIERSICYPMEKCPDESIKGMTGSEFIAMAADAIRIDKE